MNESPWAFCMALLPFALSQRGLLPPAGTGTVLM
jgi:hypothetical protein